MKTRYDVAQRTSRSKRPKREANPEPKSKGTPRKRSRLRKRSRSNSELRHKRSKSGTRSESVSRCLIKRQRSKSRSRSSSSCSYCCDRSRYVVFKNMLNFSSDDDPVSYAYTLILQIRKDVIVDSKEKSRSRFTLLSRSKNTESIARQFRPYSASPEK